MKKSNYSPLEDINLLYYGIDPSEPAWFASMGATTTEITDPSVINPGFLSQFDVFFIGYAAEEEHGSLSGHSSEIVDYIFNGGGVILEQPSETGYESTFLPPGYEVRVADTLWPGDFLDVMITPAGQVHPITAGLTAEDISGNFDTVYDDEIGNDWEILVRHAEFTNCVALLAGEHGYGRMVFHTGNMGERSGDRGSTAYASNMIQWAAGGGVGTGSINGYVTDCQTGGPIKWALVIAIQKPTKVSTFTNGDGHYEISDLESGEWWLIGIKKGYKLHIAKIEVKAGETTNHEFCMEPK